MSVPTSFSSIILMATCVCVRCQWGGRGQKEEEGGGAGKGTGDKGVGNGRRKGNKGGEKEKRKKGRGLEEDGVMEVQLHFSAIQRAMAQWYTYVRMYLVAARYNTTLQ